MLHWLFRHIRAPLQAAFKEAPSSSAAISDEYLQVADAEKQDAHLSGLKKRVEMNGQPDEEVFSGVCFDAAKVPAVSTIQHVRAHFRLPSKTGGGGGRPDMAQAGGKNPSGLPAALAKVKEIVAG